MDHLPYEFKTPQLATSSQLKCVTPDVAHRPLFATAEC